MKSQLNKVALFLSGKTEMMKQKAVSFMKEEKSAKGTLEEGYMGYAVIILGIIVLGLAAAFFTDGFTTIGDFFNDGVTGADRDADGWGN